MRRLLWFFIILLTQITHTGPIAIGDGLLRVIDWHGARKLTLPQCRSPFSYSRPANSGFDGPAAVDGSPFPDDLSETPTTGIYPVDSVAKPNRYRVDDLVDEGVGVFECNSLNITLPKGFDVSPRTLPCQSRLWRT